MTKRKKDTGNTTRPRAKKTQEIQHDQEKKRHRKYNMTKRKKDNRTNNDL
jgi:hypothetical protein